MIDYIIERLVDSGISIFKDILLAKVKQKNDEQLKSKIKAAEKKKLSPVDVQQITLDDHEEITCQVWIDKNEEFLSLRNHLAYLKDWASFVGFSDLRGKKSVKDIYVELDTFLIPLRRHFDNAERVQKKSLTGAIFENNSHKVILGQPGAGKTTSLKKICSALLDQAMDGESDQKIPFLVRLRDLPNNNGKEPLFTQLRALISLEFELRNAKSSQIAELVYPALLSLLDEFPVVLILDGFDEIATGSLRDAVLKEFRMLCSGLKKSQVILTCRSGEFNYHIDGADVFEIAPLSECQIRDFAYKWMAQSDQASSFLDDIRTSPFADTIIKPLSLAHLCAIYERIGKIPEKPKTVYRKVINLMLEEWDEQRSIRRNSRYAQFESDRKAEFLSNLAYFLTTESRTTVFSKEQFYEAYRNISRNFGLPENQELMVVSELESHTGLFVQSGYDQFEFTHKSLQEYLAADYIVRLPGVPKGRRILETIPNELAIAVAISSNPSWYLSELIINVLSKTGLPNSFYDTFVNRLVLEKPEFYEFEDLVLAMHVLLTFWVCEGDISMNQIRIRNIRSDSLKLYIDLSKTLSAKISNNRVLDYYCIESEFPVSNTVVPLYRLRRKCEHKHFALPLYIVSYVH
jgi:hypothetical protein